MSGSAPGETRPGPVRTAVVGVDGSDHSLAALRWAAEVVGSTGTIDVVTVGHQENERDVLEKEWLEALKPRVRLHLAGNDPAEIMVDLAAVLNVDLIAVGAHSGVARSPRRVGGVVHKILRLANCPVAVVRDRSELGRPLDSGLGGDIVVGVGDGPSRPVALAWAADLAADRSRAVRLVRAVNYHPFLGVSNAAEVLASYIDPAQLVVWAGEELDLVAGTVAERGVEVEKRIVAGDVGTRLVEESEHAEALVVGKHFDGRVTGFFTGRTVHHVLAHAWCPVVIVPGS